MTADASRTGWVPNTSNATPWPLSPRRHPTAGAGAYGRLIGTVQAPMMIKGPAMSDKSPRQGMSKKSGKSLKEKRADKNAKAAGKSSAIEDVVSNKKR